MTIHKAQGATYDHCLILASDQLTKESAYTAMSRGRVNNTLYLVGDSAREHDTHTREIEQPLVERVRASIYRTAAQSMALAHDPTADPDVDADHGIDL